MSVIDFFCNVYFKIENKNFFLTIVKYYAMKRFFIRVLWWGYILLTRNNSDYCLEKCDKKTGRIIVSFTSFPGRIHKAWIVVESILRQTLKPDKLILWLSKEQFSTLDSLPKKLLNQRKRGLEIVLVDGNIRSYKKYYAIKEYPEDYIITIDDDLIYHSMLIQKLVDAERKYPRSICSFSRRIPTYRDGVLEPFNKWDTTYREYPINGEILNDDSGKHFFFLTGIGTLYPPHSLYKDFFNMELALKLCPLADDIWLNTMARLKGTKLTFVPGFGKWYSIYYFNKITLDSVNSRLGLNDVQIEFIRKHYIEKLGIDPYKEED